MTREFHDRQEKLFDFPCNQLFYLFQVMVDNYSFFFLGKDDITILVSSVV